LFDDQKKIFDKQLFPQDKTMLLEYITSLRHQEILSEEKELAKDKKPIVFEKRLQSIGEYNSAISPSFVHLDPESYGFALSWLHEILVKVSREHVHSQLSSPDFQVIQQVNALDELQQMTNIVSERIATWNIYPSEESIQQPLTNVLDELEKNQQQLKKQIEYSVNEIAPNISEVVGSMIAARLIAHAGSLRKLAMLPSSSVQLLGAEKALFRFKKDGGKPPKHGIIFQHPLISKAPFAYRGKHARFLSAKISIAAKADMFTKRFIAEDLKNELAEQCKKEKE